MAITQTSMVALSNITRKIAIFQVVIKEGWRVSTGVSLKGGLNSWSGFPEAEIDSCDVRGPGYIVFPYLHWL